MHKDKVPTLTDLEDVLEETGQVGLESGRTFGDATALIREGGCQNQTVHTDWNFKQVKALKTTKPRSAWVVLEKGAKLTLGLLPSTMTLELMARHLNVGDIVLFDGDVPHAGSAYLKRNIGMHVYLDVAGVVRISGREDGSFHPMQCFGRVAAADTECSSCGAVVQHHVQKEGIGQSGRAVRASNRM